MQEMKKWGWKVTWACPEKVSTLLPSISSLATPDFQLRRVDLDSNEADTLLKEYQPDVVIFDSFFSEEQWSWRVMAQCPQALRVTDSQDFHSLRFTREQLAAEGMYTLYLSLGVTFAYNS